MKKRKEKPSQKIIQIRNKIETRYKQFGDVYIQPTIINDPIIYKAARPELLDSKIHLWTGDKEFENKFEIQMNSYRLPKIRKFLSNEANTALDFFLLCDARKINPKNVLNELEKIKCQQIVLWFNRFKILQQYGFIEGVILPILEETEFENAFASSSFENFLIFLTKFKGKERALFYPALNLGFVLIGTPGKKAKDYVYAINEQLQTKKHKTVFVFAWGKYINLAVDAVEIVKRIYPTAVSVKQNITSVFPTGNTFSAIYFLIKKI